jgi:enoyl-CoA hydratase/carnithine racemase/alkylation response protein AidB-like acyl-CoA dehydrogenase
VGVPVGSGTSLAAPTILAVGPDLVRERFLLPTLTGEVTWCQLFSEPGAGSDLAGLTTHAELDGDEWVVNGQKVWNTSAHHADLGMLLARTDWDAPKHKGITYFVVPMHQPGVEARPLRQMNMHASFNEVFLTDARIPRDDVVGAVNDGWRAALTTLAFERRFGAMSRPRYAPAAGRALRGGAPRGRRPLRDVQVVPATGGRPISSASGPDHGCAGRPVVRQEVARVLTRYQSSRWTSERSRAALASGRTPGPEGSVGKLAMSDVAREAARVHSLISGAAALLTDGADPLDAVWPRSSCRCRPSRSPAAPTRSSATSWASGPWVLPREPAPTSTVRSASSRAMGDSAFGAVAVSLGDDFVATVEIRRPPNNFFDVALVAALADAYEDLARDAACRAIVLCSEGKHFCAGADFSGGSEQGGAALYREAARVFAAPLPVVAAVQGAAVGGGLGLACSADFRVAAPEARFSANFAQLGFHHGFALSVSLPRLVGQQHALDLLYTGRRIGGEEAAGIGLCDRLVACGELRREAHRLAAEIASSAPLAVRSIRATMRADLVERVGAAMEREAGRTRTAPTHRRLVRRGGRHGRAARPRFEGR